MATSNPTFIFEILLEDSHTILRYRREKRIAKELNLSSVTREMVRKESDWGVLIGGLLKSWRILGMGSLT